MNKEDLAEQLKYSSSECLYIVTWNNLLKQLFCPFKVFVIQEIGDLKKGEVVWVEEIKVTIDLKTVYMIGNNAYYYNHFDIVFE